MKIRLTLIFSLFALVSTVPVFAQKSNEKPNPEIQKMLKEVSAKNIETTIRKLVSFGTRNTLSEQDNPTRGIGAARDYLFGEFQKISNDCGNCLQVGKTDFYAAADGEQARNFADCSDEYLRDFERHNRSDARLCRFRSL